MNILLFGRGGQVGWELQRSLSVLGSLTALDHDSTTHCGDFTQLSGLRDTVRAVLTDLRAARAQAQSSGAEVRFAVNPRARTFGVEGAPVQQVPESLELRAVMAAEEAGADGSLAIRFLPRGGASGGSVDLIRPSGTGVRLRVDWFSGRVEQEAIVP